jgi:SAM-dependent methyltransferase
MNKAKFFIREDYVENPVLTFNKDGVEKYWENQRLAKNNEYQFHVYEFAKKVFLNSNLSSVLDIGCGPAVKMKLFFSDVAKELAIIDQPLTEKVAKGNLPQANFYGANLEDSSFSMGKKFDLVICSDVIEHLVNPDSLLDIIKNHVKSEGMIVLSTPDRDLRRGLGNKQSPNKQHVREWNAAEFKKYLEYSGFKIMEHNHLPLKKLTPLMFAISRLSFLHKRVNKSSWYPNQTILMKLA